MDILPPRDGIASPERRESSDHGSRHSEGDETPGLKQSKESLIPAWSSFTLRLLQSMDISMRTNHSASAADLGLRCPVHGHLTVIRSPLHQIPGLDAQVFVDQTS
jgi:hypothetical protein